jgi:beta-1,4-N-acetylglucosaminyltransferase
MQLHLFIKVGFVSAAIVLILFVILRLKKLWRGQITLKGPLKTMIVLGSGGHTAEMFRFLNTLDIAQFSPRIYIVAQTDSGSDSKLQAFESAHGTTPQDYSVIRIPRSREVGQSYITSIFTTLKALLFCWNVVVKNKPDLVLANGPGTCVPICSISLFLNYLGLVDSKTVLAESFACVHHFSFTAKLLAPFVDLFTVQWSPLLHRSKRARYTGRLPLDHNQADQTVRVRSHGQRYVLVTVGSTLFDDLIRAVDDEEFVNKLIELGYTGMHVQMGKGVYEPVALRKWENDKKFNVEIYRYKDTLVHEISGCSLVIGHAGAGTVLDVLEAGKDLVVVPNNSLMSGHQADIAVELSKRGYLYYCQVHKLADEIEQFNFNDLKSFPRQESMLFKQYLYQTLGWPN